MSSANALRPIIDRPPTTTRHAAAWWGVALLGVVAAAIRLFAIWKLAPLPFDSENLRAGLALARTGTLSDPYALPTGATAHVAPVYPALIALAVRLWGDPQTAMLMVRSLVALLFGLFVAILPWVANALGLGRRAGLLAALAFVPCGAPIFFAIETTGQSETPLAMMALFAIVSATLIALRAPDRSARRALLLGLGWGAAALVTPVVLPALLLICAASLVWTRIGVRSEARFAGTMLLAAGIALTPWTVRNVQALGGFALVRDNLGLELGVSNDGEASADMRDNMRTTMRHHPFLSFTEAAKVAREGELAYNARRAREATAWMRAHPDESRTLVRKRLALFFYPAPAREQHAGFYLTVLLLAPIGLVMLARRERLVSMSFAGTMLCVALPYAFVQSSPRYSYPVLWILTLCAAYVASLGWEVLRNRLVTHPVTPTAVPT